MGLYRQVFFVGGFDPKSARHYHRLYRGAVGGRHAPAAGEAIGVGRLDRTRPHLNHWDVTWTEAGAGRTLTSRYTVMGWDDIVRRHWHRDWRLALKDYWRVYVDAASQGIFGRVWRASQAAWWLAMFPLLLAAATLLICGLLGGGLWLALGPEHAPLGLRWAAGLGGVLAWCIAWRSVAGRLDSEWLLRLYGFSHAQAAGQLPDLERRLDEFAAHLSTLAQDCEQQGVEELLVVGHSSGSILAACVVARALALTPSLGLRGPSLNVLTLGHCTPILAYLNDASAFRAELARLAATPHLTWLDYSAPADWAAFSKVPPWLGEGVLRGHCASPRFPALMSAADYAALRRDRHRLHMQYLKASGRSGGYDVVELTAGPMTLAQRYDRLHATAAHT